VWLKSLNGF